MNGSVSSQSSLQDEWSFWYFKKALDKKWEECLHEIASIKSVAEFWILYNSIISPTELSKGCDYALFRNSIRPMWEDEHNQNGGRWIITLENNIAQSEVNQLWLDILLLLIEGTLSKSSIVCGATFNNRWKYHKIGLYKYSNEY